MTKNMQVSVVYPTLLPVGENVGSQTTCVRLFGSNFKDRNDLYPFCSDKANPRLQDTKQSLDFDALIKLIRANKTPTSKNLLLAGGEALIQMDNLSSFLLECQVDKKEFTVDVETNGSITPTEQFDSLVRNYFVQLKLGNSTSGTPSSTFSSRINKEAIDFFVKSPKAVFVVKISSLSDISELREIIALFKISEERVWLMPSAIESKSYRNQAAFIWKLCVGSNFKFAQSFGTQIFGAPRLNNLY